MRKSRIRYIFTWVALAILSACSTLLLAMAWNSRIIPSVSPALVSLVWIGITSSGIYLFLLAVKKAHRQWVNEKRELEMEADREREFPSRRSESSKELKSLDIAGTARKIVRRVPENIALDQLGNMLLKNLARELEIMSGVFYVVKKGTFTIQASYAMAPADEPYSFKSGEGLPGQVAKNRQLMVMTRLPEGYVEVFSGLGKAPPAYLAIVPLVHKDKTWAVLEVTGYRYEPGDIENMFKILARELTARLSPNLD